MGSPHPDALYASPHEVWMATRPPSTLPPMECGGRRGPRCPSTLPHMECGGPSPPQKRPKLWRGRNSGALGRVTRPGCVPRRRARPWGCLRACFSPILGGHLAQTDALVERGWRRGAERFALQLQGCSGGAGQMAPEGGEACWRRRSLAHIGAVRVVLGLVTPKLVQLSSFVWLRAKFSRCVVWHACLVGLRLPC